MGLEYDKLLSNFGVKFNVRPYSERVDRCIGFTRRSTGCVHWILGEDTSACVAASRRTPDALWTPPDSGGAVIGQDAIDDAIMAHADEAAPWSAVHNTPEVTIGVVATLSYSSPTLAVSLRGELDYRTCDEYQARLAGKVAMMPAGGSSDAVAIFTVGATMGCPEHDGTTVYRVLGTVSDFTVIAGVTVRSAVLNASISDYLNGSVAVNGTFAGPAVIVGDVEGLEGFDLRDSSLTVSVELAKRPAGPLRLTRVTLFVELDIKFSNPLLAAASLGSPRDTPAPGSVQRYQRRHANLGDSMVQETIPSTGVANVHVWGSANFTYPCAAGERQKFSAHVSLRFDPFHLAGIFTTMTYFCQQTGPVLPAFTLTASVSSDMKLGPNIVVSAMNLQINGYNLGNGASGRELNLKP